MNNVDIIKHLTDQFEGKAKWEYLGGRIGPSDEGASTFSVTADPQYGVGFATHSPVALRGGCNALQAGRCVSGVGEG